MSKTNPSYWNLSKSSVKPLTRSTRDKTTGINGRWEDEAPLWWVHSNGDHTHRHMGTKNSKNKQTNDDDSKRQKPRGIRLTKKKTNTKQNRQKEEMKPEREITAQSLTGSLVRQHQGWRGRLISGDDTQYRFSALVLENHREAQRERERERSGKQPRVRDLGGFLRNQTLNSFWWSC